MNDGAIENVRDKWFDEKCLNEKWLDEKLLHEKW